MEQSTNYEPPLAKRRGRPPLKQARNVRCQCERKEETQGMIECSECKDWQHRGCMGIGDIDYPASYKCELCDPRELPVSKEDAMNNERNAEAQSKSKPAAFDVKDFLKYLDNQSIGIQTPFVLTEFVLGYITSRGMQTKLHTLIARFRSTICKTIPDSPLFDGEAKARMLFATSTSISQNFLNKLRENAVVEVDQINRITKYESLHGGLKLCGKHKFHGFPSKSGSKRKSPRGRRPKRISGYSYLTDDSMEIPEEEAEAELTMEVGDEITEVGFVPSGNGQMSRSFNQQRVKEEPNTIACYHQQIQTPTTPSLPTGDPNPYPANQMPAYYYPSMYPQYPQYPHYPASSIGLNGLTNFMASMTGLMMAQTNMLRDMHLVSSAHKTGGPDQVTSLKDLLKYLQAYLVHIGSLKLSTITHQIVIAIHGLGMGDREIPLDKLRTALDYAFAHIYASDATPPLDSISASHFLSKLHTYASNQKTGNFQSIRDLISQKMLSLDKEQMVPLENIGRAIETLIKYVLSPVR
ncbi:hypothetical protein GCK72_010773 [Caenorhabditis remanei]|uniref:Zinc finger PHD-type domain-containing protein n=1 Tax=Caenorhabditis remanei TaxID=31234 RepID=A0A6A5H6J4_CAERE|nr:hypothetical protein GCK72_010773 [Caenorhabditis remanei]KAF1762511.1 hypothetical protein GCK72_010773 [Caenorhabditis remanei]